ncbi:POM121-like protein 2 [Vulpes lagopus]
MGSYLSSYLGTAKDARPRPAWTRPAPQPGPAQRPPSLGQGQVLSFYRELWGRRRPLPALPPRWGHTRGQGVVVPKPWRRLHSKRPLEVLTGWDASRKRWARPWLWKAQSLLSIWNMVTVNVPSPESRGSVSRAPADQEERPHPCAEDSPPTAPSRRRRGKKRTHRPLWFEAPSGKRRRLNAEPRASAFRPVWRDGVVPIFVPRPGPLTRGFCSWPPPV